MNKCLLKNDVIIKLDENLIKIRKGIFNFFNVDITKDENFTDEEFLELSKVMKELKEGKEIDYNHDNEKIDDILKMLGKYEIINYNLNFFKVDYLLHNIEDINIFKNYHNIYTDQTQCLNLTDYAKITGGNVIVIVNKFNSVLLKEINSYFVKNNINALFLIKDGSYLHMLYINNKFSGCLECFIIRLINRIDDAYYEDFTHEIEAESFLVKAQDELTLLLSWANIIIKNSKKFMSLLIDSKLFSIYMPTFEIHIDKLLKVPYCNTCGYNSQKQSMEMNINFQEGIKEFLKNEK